MRIIEFWAQIVSQRTWTDPEHIMKRHHVVHRSWLKSQNEIKNSLFSLNTIILFINGTNSTMWYSCITTNYPNPTFFFFFFPALEGRSNVSGHSVYLCKSPAPVYIMLHINNPYISIHVWYHCLFMHFLKSPFFCCSVPFLSPSLPPACMNMQNSCRTQIYTHQKK